MKNENSLLSLSRLGLRKNTILYFGGFGGEKVQKVQRSTKSSSMLLQIAVHLQHSVLFGKDGRFSAHPK
jgi:hypothetical protein